MHQQIFSLIYFLFDFFEVRKFDPFRFTFDLNFVKSDAKLDLLFIPPPRLFLELWNPFIFFPINRILIFLQGECVIMTLCKCTPDFFGTSSTQAKILFGFLARLAILA